MLTGTRKVPVLDNVGNVIGCKERRHLLDSDCWPIVSLWIENNLGQVLLQQRGRSRRMGRLLWTPAVEETLKVNETPHRAMLRGIYEEMSLIGLPITPAGKVMADHWLDYGSRYVQGWRATLNMPVEELTPAAKEVEQFAWEDKDRVVADMLASHPRFPTHASLYPELFGVELALV